MTVMTPLMVSLFFDIQKRKFHATHFLMASLCILGTLILIYRPDSGIHFELWGFLWAQLSNASFAFGQVAYRHWANSKEFEKCSDAENFSWLYAGGIIPLLFIIPSSYWSQISSLSSTQWAVLVYLGIVASGLGIFCWNLGARKVGSVGVLAVMNNLKIPLVLVVSIFLFGEKIHLKTFALGGGIIFLSLLLERFRINLKNDKRTKF
jgi:drug/metabolite transporter (DMT)-like permease